jgi:hypothetical protein
MINDAGFLIERYYGEADSHRVVEFPGFIDIRLEFSQYKTKEDFEKALLNRVTETPFFKAFERDYSLQINSMKTQLNNAEVEIKKYKFAYESLLNKVEKHLSEEELNEIKN